jgi:hypothetical protein|tara:strand:+ start:331 stop:672 length:342 start_codon:yes stop_codon:yes gene_type:complete
MDCIVCHREKVYRTLPAGAGLVMKQWYENITDTPNKLIPDVCVMGGSRTGDEMTHVWLAVTHLDVEGCENIAAERKTQTERSLIGPAEGSSFSSKTLKRPSRLTAINMKIISR